MPNKRIKQLGKDLLIYGLGGVMARSVSFILLPIYTRIFSPSDYGSLETMLMITLSISTILTMGLDSAQSFYFFKEKTKQGQIKIVTAIFQWNLIIGLCTCIIIGSLYPIFNYFFFPSPVRQKIFVVAFAGVFTSLLFGQSLNILRLLYRSLSYTLLTLVHAVFSLGITIVLILFFKQDVWSVLIGNVVSTALVTIIAYCLVHEFIDFSQLYLSTWPRVLKFGAPLLPANIAYYLMASMDRWFLLKYHGSEVLGLYSVSLKFGLAITFAVDIFRKAWWPIAIDSMHSEDGPEIFRLIARAYVGIGAAGVVLLTYFSPLLVNLFIGPAFQTAWMLIGILAWQAFFYGFSTIASAGIWKAEKTAITSYLMLGSTILNLLLLFLLVPQLGSLGAALATIITYFAWIVILLFASDKYWPIQFPFKIFFFQIFIGGTGTLLLLVDTNRLLPPKWIVVVTTLITLFIASLGKKGFNNFWKRALIYPRKYI